VRAGGIPSAREPQNCRPALSVYWVGTNPVGAETIGRVHQLQRLFPVRAAYRPCHSIYSFYPLDSGANDATSLRGSARGSKTPLLVVLLASARRKAGTESAIKTAARLINASFYVGGLVERDPLIVSNGCAPPLRPKKCSRKTGLNENSRACLGFARLGSAPASD
jgi:hypothetical protein